MKLIQLSAQEQARHGFTHKAIVYYTDLTALGAVTSGAVALMAYTAGFKFSDAAYRIVTNFDGGATSALTLELGWNGGTTDDPNGLIEAISVHADGTPIAAGDGTGAAFATKRTGYVALDAGNIEATFAATGANFNVLTQGELEIYLSACDLTKV